MTDASTASRSLVTDLDTGVWDPELLCLLGLDGERLPEIAPCDAVVGHTDAFGRTAAVGGLVVDQPAALLGEACLQAGEAKCTFGTGAFLLVNTGATPVRSTAGLTASIAVPASAVRWKPDAKAAVHGMTLSATVGHLVVAVLEGIAAQVAELGALVAVDLGTPLTRLRVDGGLTKSRTLMQAVANLMQVDIEVYPNAHATPPGAAALARLALDDTLGLGDTVVGWSPSLTYSPQWSADQAGDFRQRWSTLADVLASGRRL